MDQLKNDIVKAFYSLFNNYEKNGMGQHSKKGSEIKSALSDISVNLNKKKGEMLDSMNEELSEINFKPDKVCDRDSDYHHLMDFIPKKFSYGLLYKGEEYVKTDNGIDEHAVKMPTSEEKSEMREYNGYVNKYMEYCVNKIKVDTLRKNIKDSKQYTLSVDQLAILGL